MKDMGHDIGLLHGPRARLETEIRSHAFKSILKNQHAKLIDFNLCIQNFLLQREENHS